MTKQGLANLLAAYDDPTEVMTKAKFGERIPGSQYEMVDLANAVEDNTEHLDNEAYYMVNNDRNEIFYNIADDLNLDSDDATHIQDMLDNGYDPLNLDHVKIAERLPSVMGGRVDNVEDALGSLYQHHFDSAVDDQYDRLLDYVDQGVYGDTTGYKYVDAQRLVPNDYKRKPGYFELGVAHPDVQREYRHYPKADNLAGHIRGTILGVNPPSILSGLRSYQDRIPDVTFDDYMQGAAARDYGFTPKPNSLLIEELQSDVQKGAEAAGPLHQIHGTLFKSAVQHAIDQGLNTVYLPTAKAIGIARKTDPAAYAPIYDQEVIKYGLNPLREIPGVEVNPINDMYYEINLGPEARQYIQKGKGQKLPGYAEGGLVDYDASRVDSIVNDVIAGKYAHGGLVDYDASKIDEMVNQIREGIYG